MLGFLLLWRQADYDLDFERIVQLEQGFDRTGECDPEDIQRSTNLNFTSDLREISRAGIYIVTVPTPIDNVNSPDLTPLCKASINVGSVLKRGDIVIYESTVYPGATEEVCVPILEEKSGLKLNQDFLRV